MICVYMPPPRQIYGLRSASIFPTPKKVPKPLRPPEGSPPSMWSKENNYSPREGSNSQSNTIAL